MDESEPIDFTWFYFIGRNKLGFTFHEVGRLTLTTFNLFYKHYKDDFDFELMLEKTGTTYAKAYEKSQHEDDWF